HAREQREQQLVSALEAAFVATPAHHKGEFIGNWSIRAVIWRRRCVRTEGVGGHMRSPPTSRSEHLLLNHDVQRIDNADHTDQSALIEVIIEMQQSLDWVRKVPK